jgi:hypothetical protein
MWCPEIPKKPMYVEPSIAQKATCNNGHYIPGKPAILAYPLGENIGGVFQFCGCGIKQQERRKCALSDQNKNRRNARLRMSDCTQNAPDWDDTVREKSMRWKYIQQMWTAAEVSGHVRRIDVAMTNTCIVKGCAR